MHVHSTEKQAYNCRTTTANKICNKPYSHPNELRKHKLHDDMQPCEVSEQCSNGNDLNSHPINTMNSSLDKPLHHQHHHHSTNDLNSMPYTNIVEKLPMENNVIIKQELEDLSNDIRQQLTAVSDVPTHHHLTQGSVDESLVQTTPWYACAGQI